MAAKKTENGKSRVAGAAYKKRALRGKRKSSAPQRAAEKAHTEILTAYASNVTKTCVDNDGVTDIAGKSSCIENIKIAINAHPDFRTNWDRFVANKYEEYRIAKVEARIMFQNTDQPVLFLIDEEEAAKITTKGMVNDPSCRSKMVKENDNTLVLSWRPRPKSTDYDYLPVRGFGDTHVPLAYLKVLQHGLSAAVGQPGCTMQLKVTVACKGLKNTLTGEDPTAAQTAKINSVMGN